jgi:hypothetical protein
MYIKNFKIHDTTTTLRFTIPKGYRYFSYSDIKDDKKLYNLESRKVCTKVGKSSYSASRNSILRGKLRAHVASPLHHLLQSPMDFIDREKTKRRGREGAVLEKQQLLYHVHSGAAGPFLDDFF